MNYQTGSKTTAPGGATNGATDAGATGAGTKSATGAGTKSATGAGTKSATGAVASGGRGARIDGFDANSFLTSVGGASSLVHFDSGQTVFRQGDPAPALYYLQQGRVQVSIISDQGKEGLTAIHGPGELFGQESLIGDGTHRGNATTTCASTIARIDNKAMMRVMQAQPSLAIMFLSFLLWRNVQIEEDLVDHLFNSSEKRLARLLLKLAGLDEATATAGPHVIARMSQEALAARIGTTRGRINYFMNKFRKLGHIDYNGEIVVRASLAEILSDDGAAPLDLPAPRQRRLLPVDRSGALH